MSAHSPLSDVPEREQARAQSASEVEALRARIRELEELVHAIRDGGVDAFVMGEEERERIYTLTSADHPYRMLVESMQEGALALSQEGTILYANQSLARMLEVPLQKVIGSVFQRFVAPSDLPRFEALLVRESGDRGEVMLRTDSGVDLPVYLSCRWVDLGNMHGICMVVTDLSEQKRHEEIVASERLARAILAQAAEAIVVCDPEGQITHASRQAEILCGRNPLRLSFDEAFPLRFADGASPGAPLAVGDAPVVGREVTLTRPDGRTYNLLLSTAPLLGEAQKVLGTVLILTDFTERKQMEQALQELNMVLEERIAERTAALEQRNRELQSFAYVASHDLQEPLRKIQSFAGLLQSEQADVLNEEGRFFLERIQNAAARMSQLLGDVLAFSRVVTRPEPFASVSVQEVVQEVLGDLELSIAETNAVVEVETPVAIEADRSQLRQLFNHLIQNAIKFRRAEVPPQVRITAVIESAPAEDRRAERQKQRPMCRIVVEDNGIGFADRFTERIFEPLQRLHGRSAYPGTGMGLAICRRIVERHHGTISATSTLGVGSRFTVVLPVHRPPGADEQVGG